MSTITRTTNRNGTYRYELDGEVIYKASKVLYTHVSHYTVAGSTPVLFHKTQAAAGKARGYAGWVKTSVSAIVDGDATCTADDAHRTVTDFAEAETRRFQALADERAAAQLASVKVAASALAVDVALAHGHDADIRAAFKTSVPPAVRAPRAPRVRAKVIANAGPSHLRGRQGRVQSKGRGDDGELYVTVDFGNDVTWPFLVSELTVV